MAGQRAADSRQSPRKDFLVAESPGYLLIKAGVVLDEEASKALATIGMRNRYFLVLASLAGGPSLSQQDLSRLLNLDPTTVVSVIDEMERNAHVERQRDPADRRRYRLHLTDAGREALARASALVAEVETEFFGSLTHHELGMFRDMLGRVMAGRWPESVCG
ncbi:hypothetical protein SRB5_70990 [Streptomyces sp. RB5]|uniref:HTH marR-type domain-containing protein n=1 Tax=Streptomyces smaragdinus TaxID=2585196 RepID=A0A7K0CTS9_9ACTN|nr:MarR family transcriptional regulator [Streptomyces smaragdinus]MQY16896.1 hypothetical protein [Streptomyces smaragdinus]